MARAEEAGAQIAVRLPGETIRRMDALRTKLAKDATVGALGRVTRSTVLKLALARGLDALEQEYSK